MKLWMWVVGGIIAVASYFLFLFIPSRATNPSIEKYQTDTTNVVIIRDSTGAVKLEAPRKK